MNEGAHIAQFVDVDSQFIAYVDEHDRKMLLTADDVHARCNDVHRLSPLQKKQKKSDGVSAQARRATNAGEEQSIRAFGKDETEQDRQGQEEQPRLRHKGQVHHTHCRTRMPDQGL